MTVSAALACSDAAAPSPQPIDDSTALGATALASNYVMIDLGIEGEAYDVNERGQIVGGSTVNSAREAFLWTQRKGTRFLDHLPNARPSTQANAINEAGEIVGYSDQGGRAFLWGPEVGMTELRPVPPWLYAIATDINDSRRVVGELIATPSNGFSRRAFVWTEAGGVQTLAPAANLPSSSALGVNGVGRVVGVSSAPSLAVLDAAMWEPDGTPVDISTSLRTLPGYAASAALAVNDSGTVAGWVSHSTAPAQAFVLPLNGTPRLIRTLGGENPQAYAADINNRGAVVGYSQAPNGRWHAFLWTARAGTQDLGVLNGGLESYARAINDAGWIVGGSVVVVAGRTTMRAVLWRPRAREE